MRRNQYSIQKIAVILLYIILLPMMQNCGDGVGFGNVDESQNQPFKGPELKNLVTNKSIAFNINTDILFVLDDSCSMQTIIDNVKNGVDSVSSLSFAPNTEMAVTYMSPALKSEMGGYDFSAPFYADSQNAPGYLQFVSQNSLDTFLQTLSTQEQSTQLAQNFTSPVCAEEWFAPGSTVTTVGGSGSCLSGAMQIPNYCTVVEAGGLVVDQLTKKLSGLGKDLFRDQSNAHIIFVSDTHDAGANFYGTNVKHPDRMPNVDELKAAILSNNPNVQSIRFSGIVPLPLLGDEKLNGLNVIGAVPQTPEEQYINSEGDHDFSYLDLIKETGGVAMHAQSDDWSVAMNELIQFTETPSSVLVLLQQAVEEVKSVKINGVVINSSQFSLKSDKKTVEVFHSYQIGQSYDIQVESTYFTNP